MGNLSRQPTSNDPIKLPESENPWLGAGELDDKVSMFLGGKAKRCAKCKRATHVCHLDASQHCPDCRDLVIEKSE
jgi:hypothetical protein